MKDYKDLIESGKLELFALGALDQKDHEEIAALLGHDEALRTEYNQIAEALGVYGKNTSVTPPAHVLEKAIAQINAENATTTKVVELKPKAVTDNNPSKWWAIAASVLLVASIGLNLKLNSDLTAVQEDYVALESQNQMMAANTVKLNEYNAKTNEMLGKIASGKMQRTYMGSTENFSGYESAVYWDKSSNEVVLVTNNLPTLSEQEQYQLWAIVDGKPVDAGVFNSSDQLASMKSISGDAVAFAVTIEPKGGSINPTMEKMVMIGNVST